jgi:hypothetical protein
MLTSKAAQKTAAEVCNTPVRSRGPLVAILGPVLAGIALIFVVLRIIARQPTKSDLFGWDDAIIVFSWFIGMPLAIIDGFFYKYGLGKDVWEVSEDNITRLLRLFYMAEIFYLLCTVTTKLALLIFFLRVFPNAKFRMVTYGIIGACGAFCIGFLFPLIFQCRPISYAWTRWDGEHEGSCINVYAGIFAHAAINMILDLVILILPMPMLAKLHISYSWRQKTHIFIMFSFGMIVTIVCILRLNALVPLRNSTNPTWDYWGSVIWSVIEQEVGIICACLPAAKVVLARLLPSWLGLTTDQSRGQTPGPYGSTNSKRFSKPAERGSVTVQGGEHGFTELSDIQTPGEQFRPKRMSTIEEVQRTRSEGGTSDHSAPASTKQWY